MENHIVSQFKLDGTLLYCRPYGDGHINETYLLLDSTARLYILQKINKIVFKQPELLMQNIVSVTDYLKQNAKSRREVLYLIPTIDEKDWFLDELGEYWRMYEFISDSICLKSVENPSDFYASAFAFGQFQQRLADFPASTLHETIPHFHDTPDRYKLLQEAVKNDFCGRVKEVSAELAFAYTREESASYLQQLLNKGELPLRVTHNDTKLNNILFDRETRKSLCIIDLDTVMPGLSVNDFGDSIRFGASSAAEDEIDLTKVNFLLPLYETYLDGFLAACGKSLTACELMHLPHGAKTMTLECGIRFLTDYINGDTYFHIHRERQNLDRCRTQFKLVSDMEKYWDKMQKAVDERTNG